MNALFDFRGDEYFAQAVVWRTGAAGPNAAAEAGTMADKSKTTRPNLSSLGLYRLKSRWRPRGLEHCTRLRGCV